MSKPPSSTALRWKRLIELQARSGLSMRDFAQEQGANVTPLAWWKPRLGNLDQPPSFLPVHVVDPHPVTLDTG